MSKKKHSFGLFDMITVLVLVAVIALPFVIKLALTDNTTYITYKIKTDGADGLEPGDAVIMENNCVGYILTAEDGIITVGAYAKEKPDGFYISGKSVHIGDNMTFYAGNETSFGVCVALTRAVVPVTDEKNN